MQRYENYLIVSDLDGTLIDSTQNISNENINAISSFVKSGGLFTIATGRTEINVLPYIKKLEINCPCILYNGAVIYDINRKKFLKCNFIDNQYLLNPLQNILKTYKDLCLQIFTEGKMFIVSDKRKIDPYVILEKQPYEMAQINDIKDEPWIKIILNDTSDVLLNIQSYLNNKVPKGIISTVFSNPTYLEILPFGVSKGSALSELVKIIGINKKRVIAIGDYYNDIEMIKTAWIGVTTGNAPPLLKKVADITVVNNDNHALFYLIKYVIPNLENEITL
ncbi:MAG TPA: HAD family phosphatase [Clostridia bacterium]|nr:HAD family phosphatase [Clostridia bacterium]